MVDHCGSSLSPSANSSPQKLPNNGTGKSQGNPVPAEPKHGPQDNDKRDGYMNEKEPAQRKFTTCFTEITKRQIAPKRKEQKDYDW